MMTKWVIGLAALFLCSCATTKAEDASQVSGQSDNAMTSVPKSGLGPQTLAAGDCGLFLWSKTNVDRFIFFAQANTGAAKFAQDSIALDLIQTASGGDIFGQFQTRLDYVDSGGQQYALTITPGKEMDGGQRIESGLFTITSTEGWQTKLPVLGVRACQPD
jgi:hypothetical protein